MALRGLFLLALVFTFLIPRIPPAAQQPPPGQLRGRDLHALRREVDPLKTLSLRHPTPTQLKALANLADKSPASPTRSRSRRPANVSKQFLTTLASLRDALIKNDVTRVNDLTDR